MQIGWLVSEAAAQRWREMGNHFSNIISSRWAGLGGKRGWAKWMSQTLLSFNIVFEGSLRKGHIELVATNKSVSSLKIPKIPLNNPNTWMSWRQFARVDPFWSTTDLDRQKQMQVKILYCSLHLLFFNYFFLHCYFLSRQKPFIV